MNIRIYNVRILTMEAEKEIFDGEVWVQGDTIAYAGPQVPDTREIWDKEIDGQGNLLMPGFKDAHTHSAMTFLRSHADDMKLDEWLNRRVFPAEAKLTGEDIYWLNKLAIMEYLTSGITSVFNMYLDKPVEEKVAEETGFRTVICESINNFGGTLEQVEEDYKRYSQDPDKLISYQLGFHAEYTTSRELMEGLAALSEKYQIPVYTHCSETKKEVEDCRSRTGMTPIAYLDSLGLFKYGGGLFHGVHLDEADFNIVKSRGLYIVTNPASNLKLASGIAPIKRYLDMGIPVAIGTDGPASNNCLDMFREMFLTTGLQKAVCDDPEAVPAMEVLKMATVNGAHAMGLPECDIIAVGKKADVILIDLQQPNMQPIQNIEKNLVYSGSKQNIKMTMVGGKILYQDGDYYLDSSKEEIFAKANESARRILG
ncbi:amidohydrolase [Clostridium sp. C105KSO13]|uniref:amidohydrolase n=1 Tax=Clostridium sp. C105KSO13 TaxID=1776045 RepID=UPI00074068A3|nr:amidohydrolase [Clostridium sp. C105KSO13]CUX42124.1 5-methylthioadenosine/S-adenosylhomocysteine deaminase [Clostridium sp. C105KSO13]